jgi:hypothetical protein
MRSQLAAALPVAGAVVASRVAFTRLARILMTAGGIAGGIAVLVVHVAIDILIYEIVLARRSRTRARWRTAPATDPPPRTGGYHGEEP